MIGSWIWIGKNQAGFDAVHIYEADKIRFVKLTAGRTHDYLFSEIQGLLSALALKGISFTHVDFVVVRPHDDYRDFSTGDVTGRLDQGWRDFSGSCGMQETHLSMPVFSSLICPSSACSKVDHRHPSFH